MTELFFFVQEVERRRIMNKKNMSKVGEYAIEILLAVAGVVWAKYTADKDFDERYEKKRQEERENEAKLISTNEKC